MTALAMVTPPWLGQNSGWLTQSMVKLACPYLSAVCGSGNGPGLTSCGPVTSGGKNGARAV